MNQSKRRRRERGRVCGKASAAAEVMRRAETRGELNWGSVGQEGHSIICGWTRQCGQHQSHKRSGFWPFRCLSSELIRVRSWSRPPIAHSTGVAVLLCPWPRQAPSLRRLCQQPHRCLSRFHSAFALILLRAMPSPLTPLRAVY